jgi:hypothetical protein
MPSAAHRREPDIDHDRHVVGPVAEIGEQTGVADDDVEFVAMQHQVFLAVGSFVDHAFGDFDAAEMHAREVAQEFVVIAGDIDDPRSLARLAQQLLDHVVAVLRPVPAALQAPAVDDVADEEDRIGVVILQEIDQEVGLRGLSSRDARRK